MQGSPDVDSGSTPPAHSAVNGLVIDLPEPPARNLTRSTAVQPQVLPGLLASTQARIAAGRAGNRLTTAALLRFAADHAVTQDALYRAVSPALLAALDLFSVDSRVTGGREEYLLRPDLGRALSPEGAREIRERCALGAGLQIIVGDGLSAAAVEANLPVLLPALTHEATAAGLSLGTPFFVRNARVGVLNAVGPLTGCRVAVLLIGERPGLGRAESLSAYFAYQPRPGHTDADRDVISNIYAGGGLNPLQAAAAIVQLAQRMIAAEASGIRLRLSPPAS